MIQYKSKKQAQICIGITMFIFASFSTAYIQLTSSILAFIIETEGYTDPILSNMIVTISSLAQIPACLLGVFLGKRMNKKFWCFIGIVSFAAGGLLIIPFSGSLTMVLALRLVVGFGSGMVTLLYTAFLPDFFEGKSLSMMLGLATSGGGFWGFVFSSLAAAVCDTHGWKAAYLLHLYAVIPLILLILLVPGKPLVTLPESRETRKRKLAPMIFWYSFLGGLLYMGVQVLWSNTSIWVRDTLSGTAAQMGIVSGMFSIFSCGARLIFGPIYSRMKEKTLCLSLVLLAAGLFLASGAQSIGMSLVAASLVGASMGLTAPACLNLSIRADPENQVAAQAITTIGFASGQFTSTYWRAAVGVLFDGTLVGTFRISGYAAVFLLAFLTLWTVAPKRKKKLRESQ